MITVHLILNAHIDPVWLWPWQAGLDETLATCRSAADRLDAHPDAFFTFGEAWGLSMVEQCDPALFARIAAHVETGRWDLSGGWWVQPDCNLPTARGLSEQIAQGRRYLEGRFRRFPRVALNVDSFGHAASLPRVLRAQGQDRYVMMRPQEHEKALPARLFLWRGFAEDEGVVTFRIAGDYATRSIAHAHIEAALRDLPPGVSHTMCFIGVGDHGGGPTEKQIAWCRQHADAFPGCRLVFSTPARFFDAVAQEGAALPVVEGELQPHAVGCYSVTRSIKLAMRRAEHGLMQAERVAPADARLDRAWRDVCFAQFHDTLAGTSIPSAYRAMEDRLGGAAALADEILQLSFRRRAAALGEHPRQRIVLFNPSDLTYDGYVLLDPWTGARWKPNWEIRDDVGARLPYQLMAPEAIADPRPRVLLRTRLEPDAMKVLFIDRDGMEVADESGARVAGTSLIADHATVAFAPDAVLHFPADGVSLGPRLALFDDPTDTWAHGVARIGTALLGEAEWDEPVIVDRGPLMVSAIAQGRIAETRLRAEWRLYRGEAGVELLLDVDWRATRQVLKLILPLPFALRGRRDGIPGGVLWRDDLDCERPLRDFTLLLGAPAVGVVCPDVFAIDASCDRVSFTLLRSPLMAHHDPAPIDFAPRAVAADQGPQRFRFFFLCGGAADLARLEMRAQMYHRPLPAADLTKGMRAESRI